MASDLKRRLRMLEGLAGRARHDRLTEAEIGESVARYRLDLTRCRGEHPYVPADAFGAMLRDMLSSTGRLFLHASPEDLFL